MENEEDLAIEVAVQEKEHNIAFKGKGAAYFGVVVVNWLLTMLTLGIYYPWAKARQLQYLYGTTEINNDPLSFHGTGKEMFKGFIKAILLFVIIYGIFFALLILEFPLIGTLFFYLSIIAILPLVIHGSIRYRMSRTSWRGIRFGYRGDRKTLTLNFFKWIFFTIITFGLYNAWMTMNLRNYLLGNIKFGSLKFKYKGDGLEFFILNFTCYLLTIFTFGIYFFWWQKKLFDYYINNLSVENDEDQNIKMHSTATGFGFLKLILVNQLILIFTLGLGYAWTVTRTLTFVFNHIELKGDIDLDKIIQTEENFKDATADDIGDMLDLDLIF